MRYILIVLMLGGCSCKPLIKYEMVKQDIPYDAFYCFEVQDFILEENTTKKAWYGFVGELKSGYESCKNTLRILRNEYGAKNE